MDKLKITTYIQSLAQKKSETRSKSMN